MSKKALSVQEVIWEDKKQVIVDIRREVFIREQHVPEELEWDGQDESAIHVLVYSNGEPVGTGRLLHTGQIGRMAVRKHHRNCGAGKTILNALINISRKNNIDRLFLNAQLQAMGFYQKQGFIRKGKTFKDAGIVHCRMEFQDG